MCESMVTRGHKIGHRGGHSCPCVTASSFMTSAVRSSTLSSSHLTYSTALNNTPLFPFPLVLPLAPFGRAPLDDFEGAGRATAEGWGASIVVSVVYPSRMVFRRRCSERICLTRFSGVVNTGFWGRPPARFPPPPLMAPLLLEDEPPMRMGTLPSSLLGSAPPPPAP